MFRYRKIAGLLTAIVMIASCGESPATESTPVPPAPAQSAPAEVRPETPKDLTAATNTDTVALGQPALWPSSDVVFDTPEAAAESFVSAVLGVTPVLGAFAAGDSRSGEIVVFSPGEVEGAALLERGVLMLRILGPSDGWFVIAAASQGVTIESPGALDRVSGNSLVVSGRGRGFEGTLVATAFQAGDIDDVLDFDIASGGVRAVLEPYNATLDISGGKPGDVVAILVRGDTGLSGDPGEFTALPVVIAEPLPGTR